VAPVSRTRFGVALSALSFGLAVGAVGCTTGLADGKPGLGGDPSITPFSSGNGSNGSGNAAQPGAGTNSEGAPITNGLAGNGITDSSGANTGSTVDANGNPLPMDQLPALQPCATPGPRLIRRLSAPQFQNTLNQVFGASDVPVAAVLTDPQVLGFKVDADAPVINGLDAELLMNYSEMVADWAVTNNHVGSYTTCQTLNDQNCRQTFIKNLGSRLSREPNDARVTAYDNIFKAEGNFADGQRAVISAMIQSPYMIYRRELGPLDRNQTQFQLTPYEVASELSYLLTNNAPDDQLRQAAANNQLGSQAQIDQQVSRLVSTDAGKGQLGQFLQSWLDVDELPGKAKAETVSFPNTLRQAMLDETRGLFNDVYKNGGGVGDLLTANYAFLTPELASFYGINGVTGNGPQRVNLPDTRVPGILGEGSFLAKHAQPENSSPVQRAHVVRERFLCDELPPVPTNLDTNLRPPNPAATNRERYHDHDANPVCYSCHQLMDPVGFTFENYDGYGLHRDMEAGQVVDSTGSLKLMPEGIDVPLPGPDNLVDYLSQSEDVRACMVRYWSYFAFGRSNWDNKQCSDDSIRQEARTAGNTLQSVLSGIVHAPQFTQRVKDPD